MASNGTDTPAIEVHKLTFAFPHSTSKLPALKDVDLVLPRGSICIMVGSNGAGEQGECAISHQQCIELFYFPQANLRSCRFWLESD